MIPLMKKQGESRSLFAAWLLQQLRSGGAGRSGPPVSELTLPDEYPEIGAYVVSGNVTIDDQSYGEGVMAVASTGRAMHLVANEETRVMVVGGEPLGKRHIYWNFVSTSRERIEQAKSDWRAGKFGKVPGDDEFIPLPD